MDIEYTKDLSSINANMIDICHDEELSKYYARFGALPGNASIFRNYNAQSGKEMGVLMWKNQ